MSSGPELYFVSFRKMEKGYFTSSCNLGKAQWITTTDPDSNSSQIDPPDTTNWGRVLVVIHGFNVNENGFEEDFDNLVGRVKQFPAASQYTHVVGILWPAEAHLVKYETAKENAQTLAMDNSTYEFRATLIKICECSQNRRNGTVDVLAHSLGNYLLFKALKEQVAISCVMPISFRYIFSCAAAVNNDSVEENKDSTSIIGEKTYYSALQTLCTKIFVLFSREDSVLEFGYPVEEWHSALGYSGAKDPQNTPSTYTQIDCSDCIHGHSEYWTSEDVYKILAKLVGLTHLPSKKTFTAQQILNRPARGQPYSLWKPLIVVFAILALFGFLYTRATSKFDNRA
ncbi:MAG: hypothetical protein K940chlam8_00311 [Chlamydiae bacterium]|nr:hypothetical protein [Chlamydiota bacterium]